MVHFTESHEAHDRTVKGSVGSKPVSTFLQQEIAMGRSVSCPSLAASSLRTQPLQQSIRSKQAWRSTMDSLMNRMLSDIDLHSGAHRDYHVSKVKFFDDAYKWYQSVGGKQARKERKSPSFITFDAEEPPLAGSMRRYKASESRWKLPSLEPEKKPDGVNALPLRENAEEGAKEAQ